MSSKPSASPKKNALKRRLARWVPVCLLATAVAWLGTWLYQRSLMSGNKRRAMQLWMDENLNADVSLLKEVEVRINLLRRSRLTLKNVEIEHPNPLFPGKFVVASRLEGRCSPFALSKLYPGRLELDFEDFTVSLEENENGEWSTDGILRPLAAPNAPFPFPLPKVSDWNAELEGGTLKVRRRGYEFSLGVDAQLRGRPGRDRIALHARPSSFSLARDGFDKVATGSLIHAECRLLRGQGEDELPTPIPGLCAAGVDGLPVAVLPFLFPGMPLSDPNGHFTGAIRFDEAPDAEGVVVADGELRDVPLSVFGLPRHAPVRLTWPVRPKGEKSAAHLRMGPPGFGAFEIHMPLDSSGAPRLLSMRGDVAALDDLPSLFIKHSLWPDWLSRSFPAIEWRSRKWLGFGWSGDNLQLNLSRTTAGMNLTGEAEMMNGRVRVALVPDQDDTPIVMAAERVDAQLLALKLSQMVPKPFHVQLSGAHANLTWSGLVDERNGLTEWGTNMVFAKPVVDLSASGTWWKGLYGVTESIIRALPEWGGGDDSELRRIFEKTGIELDQLSIVAERMADGKFELDFRAYGDSFGQVTGMIERYPDGTAEGEYLLAGTSGVIAAVERVNPDFALVLDLLANDSLGLRVLFHIPPGGEPVFSYPFLEDAKQVRDDLVREGLLTPPDGATEEKDGENGAERGVESRGKAAL